MNRLLSRLSLAALAIGVATSQGATTNVIVIGTFPNFAFSPKVISIQAGDKVIWTGLGSIHSVTGDTPPETLCGSLFPGSCTNIFNTPGAYRYHCINHVATGMTGLVNVASAPVPPGVVITDPVDGAVFAAPATVKLSATATNASGSVTNVQFFSNGNSLGSVASAPFQLTTPALGAGGYVFAAKASASSGLASTSAPVSISVVTAAAVSNYSSRVSNGQFVFFHNANPGLRYVLEGTDTLTNWAPVVTNIAVSNSMEAADVFQVGGLRFYRVGRLPNP